MGSILPDGEDAVSRTRSAIDAALRRRARFAVDWLGAKGVRPNHVTVAGLLVVLTAAPLIANGWLVLGGIVFLFGSALDGLDGELARRDEGEGASPFGGVLDATADRVGEGVTFAALAAWFAGSGDTFAAVATVLALTGANLTSYVRARAEAAGTECRVGICTRLERVAILGIGIVIHLPEVAVYALTVLTFVTVGQRLWAVRQALG